MSHCRKKKKTFINQYLFCCFLVKTSAHPKNKDIYLIFAYTVSISICCCSMSVGNISMLHNWLKNIFFSFFLGRKGGGCKWSNIFAQTCIFSGNKNYLKKNLHLLCSFAFIMFYLFLFFYLVLMIKYFTRKQDKTVFFQCRVKSCRIFKVQI